MDIVYEVCAFAGIALGLLAGALFSTNHRDLALWSTCIALVCGLIGIFAWWQDGLWEADAAATADPAKHDILAPLMPKLRIELAAGAAPEVEWFVKNASPIPLESNGVSGGIRYRDKGDDDFEKELEISKKVALIDGPVGLITPGDDSGHALMSRQILTDDLYKSIMSKQIKIYSYLAVVYTDSAGQLRSSTKCVYYDVPTKRFLTHRPQYQVLGANESRAALNIVKRPSLEFRDGVMRRLEIGKEIDYSITFTNQGGTEAQLIEHGMHYAFIKKTTPPEMAEIQVAMLINKTVLQASDANIGAGAYFQISPSDKYVLTEADVASNVFIYGKIRYLDREGGFHFNDYCLTYDGEQIRPYDKFNAVDAFAFGEHKLSE